MGQGWLWHICIRAFNEGKAFILRVFFESGVYETRRSIIKPESI